ncbi:hypothetical protein OSTOST_25473 [Ostertagia ostertagi]
MIHIAFKWFDVTDSENHHIIAADGVKFVENASREGKKYDVVVVDACVYSSSILCPIKPLRSYSELKIVKTILTASGSLIINVAAFFTQQQAIFEYSQVYHYSLFPV